MARNPFAPKTVKILHKYLSNELGYEYGIIIDCDMELRYPYFVKLFRTLSDCQKPIQCAHGQSIDEEWLDESEFEVLIDSNIII